MTSAESGFRQLNTSDKAGRYNNGECTIGTVERKQRDLKLSWADMDVKAGATSNHFGHQPIEVVRGTHLFNAAFAIRHTNHVEECATGDNHCLPLCRLRWDGLSRGF
ncbi:hypothetical protein AYO44_05995 [Planctomycetaceae bacterium SCGC AG-212-F19]|nr:hypothetical protein AYO44_05995 [Planctomycetaceae bacterium SCGC AG-212-F19]